LLVTPSLRKVETCTLPKGQGRGSVSGEGNTVCKQKINRKMCTRGYEKIKELVTLNPTLLVPEENKIGAKTTILPSKSFG